MSADDTKQLFVAVATIQNVANLPPMLELAKPGDAFVWVLSPEVAERNIHEGGSTVLVGRGLREIQPIRVPTISEPGFVAAEIDRWFASNAEMRLYKPVVILNGGTKLTPLGLQMGVKDPRCEFVYSPVQPVELWRFDKALSGRPQKQPFRQSGLDLPDILTAAGFVQGEQPGTRVWPGEKLPETQYGRDLKHTIAWHESAYVWWNRQNGLEEKAIELDINRVREFLGADKLNDMALKLLDELNAEARVNVSGVAARIFAARPRWSQAALNDYNRRAVSCASYGPLGPAFEAFVARRLCRWLDSRQPAIGQAVKSVWMNVQAVAAGRQGPAAELDVVVVLRNAIVLHLECKAGMPDIKDMLARITSLQRVTSNLAEMHVCLPAIPAAVTDPAPGWVRDREGHRRKLLDAGVRLLAVDVGISGPTPYRWGDEEVRVEPFEMSLEKLFSKYVPATAASGA